MTLRIAHFAAALGLLAATAQVSAATYYFSDCQAGAQAGCVAGNNANAGIAMSAPKRDLTGMTLVAGDTYLFARGGAWAGFSAKVALPASTKDRPTTFADYTPTWGTGSARPILTVPMDGVGFNFEDAGNADKDEGYLISRLELRGTANTGKGISVFNDADHITVDGVVIEGFELGIHVAGSNTPNAGSDGESSYFTLRNSVIRNNSAQGFLGAGPYLLIEKTTFDNNGFRMEVRDHNLYISREGANITIRGNTLTRNGRVAGGPCKSVSLVAHGYHPNMVVENNLIYEDRVTRGCYGIDLNANSTSSTKAQDFTNLIVRGNRIIFADPVETTGQAIGCSSCPGAVIENNVVVLMGSTGTPIAINVPSSSILDLARGDKPDTKATVRNNSIYIASTSTSATAIRLGRATSLDDTIVSNLMVFGPGSSASARCFSLAGRPASAFAATGHNVCHRQAGPARWSDLFATLADAQSAGFDAGSRLDDPLLVAAPSQANNWAFVVKETSNAVNGGHTTVSAKQDITGRLRDTRPDVGAYEWVTQVSTDTPTDTSTDTSTKNSQTKTRPQPPGKLAAR